MDTRFREGLSELGLCCVLGGAEHDPGLPGRPGQGPMPAKPRGGRGRPPLLLQRSPDYRPVSVREPVVEMGEKALRQVSWPRQGRG